MQQGLACLVTAGRGAAGEAAGLAAAVEEHAGKGSELCARRVAGTRRGNREAGSLKRETVDPSEGWSDADAARACRSAERASRRRV
jgi:hypothetical protein